MSEYAESLRFLISRCAATQDERNELRTRADQLLQWVSDLQSGMYVNCVYCGHRYGPEDEVPVAMADALTAHIEQCPEHPLNAARQRIEELEGGIDAAIDSLGTRTMTTEGIYIQLALNELRRVRGGDDE